MFADTTFVYHIYKCPCFTGPSSSKPSSLALCAEVSGYGGGCPPQRGDGQGQAKGRGLFDCLALSLLSVLFILSLNRKNKTC